MAISNEEVRHIALLSRLKLDEDEIRKFAEHLTEILEYAEKLNELNTNGVEPTSHVIPIKNVMRSSDRIAPSLSGATALRNAPETAEGCFKVPRVTE